MTELAILRNSHLPYIVGYCKFRESLASRSVERPSLGKNKNLLLVVDKVMRANPYMPKIMALKSMSVKYRLNSI